LSCIALVSPPANLALERQIAVRWQQSHARITMITTDTIALQREGARAFDAYLARPAGKAPAIVIFTEMFGLSHHNREMADSYARRGFVALVPNLFWRSEYPGELASEGPDRDAAWARLKAFDVEAAGRDIVTAVDWLRAQPCCDGKVLALGFCAGGRMAFVAAARAKVDAAVSFYGMGIAQHAAEFAEVACPVQLHYGMKDPHIPAAEVDEVKQAARKILRSKFFATPRPAIPSSIRSGLPTMPHPQDSQANGSKP
jgi:carboxymethylenebutenolidase